MSSASFSYSSAAGFKAQTVQNEEIKRVSSDVLNILALVCSRKEIFEEDLLNFIPLANILRMNWRVSLFYEKRWLNKKTLPENEQLPMRPMFKRMLDLAI